MTDNSCIFCSILAGTIPSQAVFEDDYVKVIKDIQPEAPVHVLIISKEHIPSLNEAISQQASLLGHIQLVAAKVAREMGIDKSGYRLLNNCGDEGGQTVAHLHYHLLGGRRMLWPPG